MPRATTNIFEFLDYRSYLKAFYEAEKARTPRFSYRAFSRRIGARSPNQLKRVIDGERSLTPAMSGRYAKALNLSKTETKYLDALVEFTEAKSPTDRERAYRSLLHFQEYRNAHRLDASHAEYHAHWFIPAIRELAMRSDFRGDPAWIATRMRPAITRKQASGALRVLVALGLLARDDRGRLVPTSSIVTTGPQTSGPHIRQYHRTMIAQGIESMDNFGPDERDLSSVTICVDQNAMPGLKNLIAEFRRECLARSQVAKDPSQVVQINIQLFPLSKRKGER